MNTFNVLAISLALSLFGACRHPVCEQEGASKELLGDVTLVYDFACSNPTRRGSPLSIDIACCKRKAIDNELPPECTPQELDCASAVAVEAELFLVPRCSHDPKDPSGSTSFVWVHQGQTIAWCNALN